MMPKVVLNISYRNLSDDRLYLLQFTQNSLTSDQIFCSIRKNAYICSPITKGEVAEWSIAAVLKTVELRGSGGSNPSLSAKNPVTN